MPEATPEQITAFIERWKNSGAAERANYQMFLSELCDIIGVPRPDPTSPDTAKNLYVFARAITRTHLDGSTTTNYIDLYKARHFVNETKQGVSDCSVGLRPSNIECSANEAAPSLSRNGIDGHRPPLQSSSSAAIAPIADILAQGGPDAEALEQQILTHLVALNHERAAEEKRGLIRYLRPDYQAPATSDGHRRYKPKSA